MDERLIAIAAEMEQLAIDSHDHNGDPEVAHGRADDLLLDTIDKLMTKENSAVLIRICEAYAKVYKWYA